MLGMFFWDTVYILFVRKLEMHRNKMSSYGVKRQLDDYFCASSRESGPPSGLFCNKFRLKTLFVGERVVRGGARDVFACEE